MLKHLILLFVYLCSSNAFAFEKYRGMISTIIVEENGSTFRGDNHIKDTLRIRPFDKKVVLYLKQTSGQKTFLVPKHLLIDSSKNTKYHLTIDILSRKNDNFNAKIVFFENSFKADENGDLVLVSKEIKNEEVKGQLNSKNDYTFVNDGKPNLKISLDIDRVFSHEEIKKRFSERQLTNK